MIAPMSDPDENEVERLAKRCRILDRPEGSCEARLSYDYMCRIGREKCKRRPRPGSRYCGIHQPLESRRSQGWGYYC